MAAASLLGLLSATILGYVLARGDVCFHSMFRGVVTPGGDRSLFKAYLLAVALQVPVLAVLDAAGVLQPYIPPLRPLANVAGGLVFGAGMVVAASCVSGLFTKFGQGMVGAGVGIAGWALGDILAGIGPLAPLRQLLEAAAAPDVPQTLPALFGGAGTVLAVIGGITALVALLGVPAVVQRFVRLRRQTVPYTEGRSNGSHGHAAMVPGLAANTGGRYWTWKQTGVGLGLAGIAGWLIALAAGQNFAFGSVGGAASVVQAATGQGQISWASLIVLGVAIGSVIAARTSGTGWLRGETFWRYTGLGTGALLLGVGASIAGGCNLGHMLTGVPLLSFGSLLATVSMAAGVWLAAGAAGLIARSRAKLPAEASSSALS